MINTEHTRKECLKIKSVLSAEIQSERANVIVENEYDSNGHQRCVNTDAVISVLKSAGYIGFELSDSHFAKEATLVSARVPTSAMMICKSTVDVALANVATFFKTSTGHHWLKAESNSDFRFDALVKEFTDEFARHYSHTHNMTVERKIIFEACVKLAIRERINNRK